MIIPDEFIRCDTCKSYTNQLLLKEIEDLVISGSDTLTQDFRCGDCQRTNTRVLHKCDECECFGTQTLIDERKDTLLSGYMVRKFKCDYCGEINESTRETDEMIARWLNATDEKGGFIVITVWQTNFKLYLTKNVVNWILRLI